MTKACSAAGTGSAGKETLLASEFKIATVSKERKKKKKESVSFHPHSLSFSPSTPAFPAENESCFLGHCDPGLGCQDSHDCPAPHYSACVDVDEEAEMQKVCVQCEGSHHCPGNLACIGHR